MRPVLALLALLLLAACKTELHRGLSQREANDVVAALVRHGIAADRVMDPKDRTVTVRVDPARFADAVELLRAQGLPRQQFTAMNDVFRGDGLVASPMEERARLLWAMGQELSRTVAEIDGVLAARVHLVLPENDPLRRDATPSSAAVFVRHAPQAELAPLVPQIKLLVASAVAGLTYDRVAVTLVPATLPPATELPAPRTETVLGLRVEAGSADPLRIALAALVGVIVIALGALAWLAGRGRAAGTALRPAPARPGR